jgi:LuxR family maltose regulon positive regulatory protein
MSTPLLKTKLYIPPVRPRERVVPRPRLIERLNAGLHRQLTLISASAGFGKTTLVVDWVAAIQNPQSKTRNQVAWLSLDEGDNDPVRFLTYLTAALQNIDQELGQAAQGLLGAPQIPAVELAMTALINAVASVPEPFVLVLDDYHHIRAEWIHQALEFLINHQPPQLHLVLTTRTDPPLPLPRLRVRGQVTEITVQDLRFTTDEATAFLNQTLGWTLDAEVVAALEARTEGWIAGLQLTALALQAPLSTQSQPDDFVAAFVSAFSGSHRHVIDYLTDEVLAQQPAEIRGFLRQTAILNRLTAPLCDAVTGRDDSAALLKQLDRANLFLIPLDDQRTWYRYHSLFADFLRTELAPATQGALHLKAARWFAAQDLLPEAVRHALDSGDMAQAAQMVALAAEDAFRTASVTTLSGWLDALPDELVRSNSELATYKGFLLFLIDRRDEVAAYADAAERNLPPDAPPHSRGRLLSLRAHLAQCHGAIDSSIQLSRAALEQLGDSDAFFRDLAYNVLGQALELQGDVAAAADVYRDAFLSRHRTGNQLGTVVVLTNLAFALNELGQRRQALELCQQLIGEQAIPSGYGFSLNEGAYLPWSLLSLEANELSLAREQAQRSLALCQQGNIIDGVLWAQYVLACIHLAHGEIDALRETCRAARQLATQANRFHGTWFAALEAQASLGEGDLATAASWARAANLTPADVPQRWNEFPYFTYVRLLLAQHRPEEARTLLASLERSAGQGERRRKLITIYLQQALVHQDLGHAEQALARVEDALRLAAPQDYRRAFLDEGASILDLLSPMRHIAPAFVDSLQASRSESASPAQGALIEPLTDREVEILRLIAAGRSNPEIAELLYLSLNTVKWHAKNLYGKLGASNRVEAITRAQELDLL